MKLEARTYGEGTPLVLLHGLLGAKENWHTVAGKLESEFRVIVPDLRNHAESPHSRRMDYPAMAADVFELLDSKDLPSARIVGHSMGGKVAMEMALKDPMRVDRLLVEDMVPGKTTAKYSVYVKALMDIDPAELKSRKDAEQRLGETVQDRTMVLFLLKNLHRRRDGGYEWMPDLEAISASYDQLWTALRGDRTFDGPTLFVRGGRSDTVSEDRLPEIHAYFPNAEVVTIEDAGHWVHADAQEEFLRLVRRHMID